ncbi:DNA primase [Nocardia otitidiscaviarum]|uniref:DNA primase n=1 Tax=Nocardia otitidiscaviarum TaxID=1823 RepID=A0A516NU09_9NOCA|nr:bifunctional DNA primase/polymerase [Nocardia otitidiscaviarum]MCP9621769.1 bifunctional DNA primase/polymerase [Nocardia otitidiscaviarum]QDP82405.1 DNA primase [Nocardia otitidiscaviarum]
MTTLDELRAQVGWWQYRDHALAYARAGLPVLPLIEQGKAPATAHGKDDATTDPAQVAAWWPQGSCRNIGVRPPVGVVVLDVDPRSGGTLESLGALPDTWIAETGGGGWHCWFRHSGRVRGKVAGLAGVDIKSNSGYLVMPPSQHPNGGHYQWLTAHPIAPLPVHLVDAVAVSAPTPRCPPTGAARATDSAGLLATVAGAGEGNRNSALFWAACRVFEQYGTDAARLAQLVDAARSAGLSDIEIERTLRSAERRCA